MHCIAWPRRVPTCGAARRHTALQHNAITAFAVNETIITKSEIYHLHSIRYMWPYYLVPKMSMSSTLNYNGYATANPITSTELSRPALTAPTYLTTDIRLVSEHGRPHLRFSSCRMAVPRTPASFGDRSFAVTGPRLWNGLPANLRLGFDNSGGIWKHIYLGFRNSSHSDSLLGFFALSKYTYVGLVKFAFFSQPRRYISAVMGHLISTISQTDRVIKHEPKQQGVHFQRSRKWGLN